MGGGDLNLKKSWHPHTMKNQEKVWKAEQAKSQEEKKLNDLRKEIEEEKNREELKRIGRDSGVLAGRNEEDKKLDWMYKNSNELINREEYLLGRKIDKSFEVLQAEEKEKEQQNLVGIKQPLNHVEHECVPFSIRSYKNLENSEQVDMQRKVMEDPLMLIKQREMESRRKILENPVKLKELHRILKTDEKLRKVSKKSKKNKKSKKRHKKRKLNSSSSSSRSSDSDLDSKLAKKLKGGLLSKDGESSGLGVNLAKLLDSKFEKISHELDKAVGKSGRTKKHKHKARRSDSDSDLSGRQSKSFSYRYEDRPRNKDYHRARSNSKSKDFRRKSRSKSTERTEKSKRDREERIKSGLRNGHKSQRRISTSPPNSKNNSGEYRERSRSKSRERKMRHRERSKSPLDFNRSLHRNQKDKELKASTTSRPNKLTNEEKQAKLKEMMSNAAWREEERAKKVRYHREANAREEQQHANRNFDKNFVNKEVKKAIDNQTSVGVRLRANLNNIQRTSSSMNSSFVRK